MKKLMILAMFLMISATMFAQVNHINYIPQVWNNTPKYASGGAAQLVLNKATNRMEYTSGSVIGSVESDSVRNYTSTGASLCYVKRSGRDTVLLPSGIYAANQVLEFMGTATTADTTVFIPSSGTINGAANYTLTGINPALKTVFNGTNYFILNKQ
jgi:hypothetical protein